MPPLNVAEALLAKVWIVGGAVFMTTVTSGIAATLIESQVKQQEIRKKHRMLTAFLGQRRTPILLSLAVDANFTKKVFEEKALSEKDLPFIQQLIDPSLRAALRESHYGDNFSRLPFLQHVQLMYPPFLQDVCFLATEVAVLDAGEELFAPLADADHAIVLVNGALKYSHSARSRFAVLGDEDDAFDFEPEPNIPQGTWISELALLVAWKTTGGLTTISESELLLVSAEQFVKVVMECAHVAPFVAAYAVYVSRILQMEENLARTDINSGMDCDVIVSNLHLSIRTLVSKPVLEIIQNQHPSSDNAAMPAVKAKGLSVTARMRQNWKKGASELEREVKVGKCHLVVTTDESSSVTTVGRVVRVVLLHLTNAHDMLCVHLAECEYGSLRAKFQLPGCKVRGHESAEDAIRRLLKERLHGMAAAIRLTRSQVVVEYATSTSYDIQTKYIKTIYSAYFSGELENPTQVDRNTSHRPHMAATRPGALGFLRKATSERLVEEADLAISPQVLAGDGKDHGFVVQHLEAGVAFESQTAESIRFDISMQSQLSTASAQEQLGHADIFAWMAGPAFTALYAKQQEMQVELLATLRAQGMEWWERLMGWRLQDGSFAGETTGTVKEEGQGAEWNHSFSFV